MLDRCNYANPAPVAPAWDNNIIESPSWNREWHHSNIHAVRIDDDSYKIICKCCNQYKLIHSKDFPESLQINSNSRKLASIRRVLSVAPIEGADKIECITIDGWKLVSQKGNFQPGDLCVYFEIDSFLPVKPEFEFLRKGCYKNTEHLGEGFRIKTIKLKGQISQGLALPLKEFNLTQFQEGDDVTSVLEVRKWEVPIPAQLAGKIKGNFPVFIPKTDAERAQNLVRNISKTFYNSYFEVTQKLNGSSMTVYHYNDYVGVCSRNLDILEDDTNSFWRIANQLKLPSLLKEYKKTRDKHIAIQGELIGPGVQKNREGLKDLDFYVYNIYDINEARYVNPDERALMMIQFEKMGYKMNHVPIIGKMRVSEIARDRSEIMPSLLLFAQGKSLNKDTPREGVVFKDYGSEFNFKVINNDYLLQGGE